MGTNIEREIVQMVLDAKGFQSGVQTSIKQIEDLKKSFDFTQAQQTFGELERGSHISFSPLAQSLDSINSKLSILGVAAATVVSRITNAVIDGAKRIANVILLEPIKMGLEEYETQLNAVQTILANTARDGTTLETVNAALDDLNLYADRTIYNFTQMTDSIGRFTAAGVDLDTSVASIKGIANVAAISGSNAHQASTAMYQLSQAIASGTIRLQDWMSVENAGMGGQVFQDALIETARVHGVAIDTILEEAGSFRYSLQEQWLTADIMTETLTKFTGDLTAAQLESMGYTEDQIVGIMKMAETANDAATKIKTLTQLKDTMQEAMQSGWAQTWRIVFGDFEEAKVFWGEVAEIFGGLIEGSANARNRLLEMWSAAGGRDAGIAGVLNVIKAVINVMQAMGEAFRDIFPPTTATTLLLMTRAFKAFSERLLEASQNTGPLKSVVRGIAAAIDILRLAAVAVLRPILSMVQGLSPAAGSFVDTAASIGDAIVAFREFVIESDLFNNIVAVVIEQIGLFAQKVRELVDRFLELGVIQDISKWLEGLERDDFIKVWEGFLKVLQAIATPFVAVALGAKELYLWLSKLDIVQKISDSFRSISWDGIKTGFKNIADSIAEFIDGIKNSDLVEKFNNLIATFDGRRFRQWAEDAKESFGWLTGLMDKLNGQMTTMETTTADVGTNMGDISEKIGEGLGKIIDWLTEASKNIDYSAIFEMINTGLLAGVVIALKKLAGGWNLNEALEGVFGERSVIGGAISGALDGLQSTLKTYQNNIKADTLKQIAIAIALLAASLALITFLDTAKLGAATLAIAGLVATLFGASGAIGKLNPQDAITASIAIGGLALALVVVSVALAKLSKIPSDNIETTLAALTAGLVGLVVSVKGLGTTDTSGALSTIALLFGVATALKMLTGTVEAFGQMQPGVLAQGLKAIAMSMGLLVTSLVTITKFSESQLFAASMAVVNMAASLLLLKQAVTAFGQVPIDILTQGLLAVGAVMLGFAVVTRIISPNSMVGAAIALGIMSGALLIMVKGIKAFGAMDWDTLIRGLVGLGGAIAILVVAANLMRTALPGAAAILVMSFAVSVLSDALIGLASLSWEGLGIALAGMAGAFVVLGLAGVLLVPIVPVLMALGAAVLLLGLGAGALGLGLLAASAGLVMLAGAGTAVSAAVGVIGTAIIKLLPALGSAIAEGMANFLTTVANYTPQIVEAMKKIVLGMIQGVADLIPAIVATVYDMLTEILETIADRLPDLIQAGFDILLAFLQGIADNIAEVVKTGLDIITAIMEGIEEGIPDLIDQAFSTLLTFLNAIADAIEEYMPQILAAGVRIGTAIIEGLATGLMDGVLTIGEVIKDLVEQAIAWFKSLWGIESPSKVTYQMGEQIMTGLGNGLRDYGHVATNALTTIARNVQNGTNSLLTGLRDGVNDSMDFNPVITPVLDLTQVDQGVGSLQNSLRGTSIAANVTADQTAGTRVAGQTQTGLNGTTYIQNNYSPKALDPADIYRQTKTLVARLATP